MNDYRTMTARVTSVSHHYDRPAATAEAQVAGPSSEPDVGDRGLKLFREGHTRQAMPLLEQAAEAGDARAQYVCATALFNGDHLPCDVARAFVLMQRASDAGLPQAIESLEQMRGITASAAQSVSAADDTEDEQSLLSAAALAQCRATLAGCRPQIVASDHPVGSLGEIVQTMLEIELRERLEVLLPAAFAEVASRDRTLAALDRS